MKTLSLLATTIVISFPHAPFPCHPIPATSSHVAVFIEVQEETAIRAAHTTKWTVGSLDSKIFPANNFLLNVLSCCVIYVCWVI